MKKYSKGRAKPDKLKIDEAWDKVLQKALKKKRPKKKWPKAVKKKRVKGKSGEDK